MTLKIFSHNYPRAVPDLTSLVTGYRVVCPKGPGEGLRLEYRIGTEDEPCDLGKSQVLSGPQVPPHVKTDGLTRCPLSSSFLLTFTGKDSQQALKAIVVTKKNA